MLLERMPSDSHARHTTVEINLHHRIRVEVVCKCSCEPSNLCDKLSAEIYLMLPIRIKPSIVAIIIANHYEDEHIHIRTSLLKKSIHMTLLDISDALLRMIN